MRVSRLRFLSIRGIPRLVGESATYAVAGAIGKGLSLITVPIVSRELGPGAFGLTDLATATAFVLVILAMFGGDIPAARLARDPVRSRRVFGSYVISIAIVSLFASALLWPAADFVASTVWSVESATDIARLSLVLVPVSAVQAALVNVHRLNRRPASFAVLQTIDLIAQLLCVLTFVLMGFGAAGALLGYVIGSSIGLLIAAIWSRPLLSFGLEPFVWANLIKRGTPFLPALLAFVAADYIARAIVASALGEAAVGSLAIAIRLASTLALLSAAFQLAWGPRALAMDPSRETARYFGYVMLAYSSVGGLASVALSSVSPELVHVFAGSGFEDGALALPGLAFAAVLAGSYYILSMAAGIVGRGWIVGLSSVVGGAVQIASTGWLIGSLGLLAVGVGAVVGRAASMLALTPRVYGTFDRRIWTAAALLALTMGACVGIGWLNVNPSATAIGRWALAVLSGSACFAVAAAWLRNRPVPPS